MSIIGVALFTVFGYAIGRTRTITTFSADEEREMGAFLSSFVAGSVLYHGDVGVFRSAIHREVSGLAKKFAHKACAVVPFLPAEKMTGIPKGTREERESVVAPLREILADMRVEHNRVFVKKYL